MYCIILITLTHIKLHCKTFYNQGNNNHHSLRFVLQKIDPEKSTPRKVVYL
jgi:hypothetical protein